MHISRCILFAMDQLTREDIVAAAAAHQELGPHFDGAVAESLVERIGEEIDKRVDARLGERSDRRGRVRRLTPAGQLSAMGLGIGATAAALNAGDGLRPIESGQVFLCVLIWVVIGIINVSYARRR